MRIVLAVLMLAAIVGVVPSQAQTVKVMIAGSSALWQALGVGAFNNGNCPSGGTAPCSHYTNSSFNLVDTRPTIKGGSAATDVNAIWIVWDSAATPNVWAYIKVDSVVGNRCYFARPHCTVSVSSFPGAGNLISAAIWGADSMPPVSIQSLFTGGGVLVNVGATDIRPEDAMFAQCRVNSQLGGGTDGLAGLGYGTNASGACPGSGASLAQLVGSDLLSGYPGSASTAHPLAFNISGKDPFSGTTIPKYTTVSVGAAPIVFVINRQGALANVTNATDAQLQTAFSGTTCKGNVFAGGTSGNIQVYLREPLSGTMNTTEATVFRYPDVSGVSQETGIGGGNPVAALACGSGGSRFRSIGSGEEVKFVLNSNANFATDGIGYTFFSYGNVSSIANNANYGYVTLNGVDPIFHKYGTTIDPGQPATAGALPNAATLPGSCAGAFPCPEGSIWSGHLSFPNLRNGSYRAWSLIRLVSDGAGLTNAKTLVATAQASAVNITPDFVPAVKVGTIDPGLPLLRSHYTQQGVAPVNVATSGDKGGDMGGCILTSTGVVATSDTTTKLAQAAPGTSCVSVP
jgi:hypothetical protein